MTRQGSGMQHLAPAPIPTYEEAISRPSSSQRSRGVAEISDDAERQGFLGGSASYRRPTVESARDSMDSSLSVPDMTGDEHDDRRQLEELDYMEPGESDEGRTRNTRYHRARLRGKISQQLSNLTATLGAIRLPNFRRLYAPVRTDTGTETAPDPADSDTETRWGRGIQLPAGYKLSLPIIARLVALFMIVSFFWLLFTMDFLPGALHRPGMAATMFDPESVRQFVQENLDMGELGHYVEHLSSFAHEAGSEGNYFLAKWMQDKWEEVCELSSVDYTTYSILANYPAEDERGVRPLSSDSDEWSAKWEESIDPDRPDREQTFAWHGHSKTGTVRGRLVIVNNGDKADYTRLADSGHNFSGAIALVTASGSDTSLMTAMKVRNAQDAGCVGVLLGNGDLLNQNYTGELPDGAVPPEDTVHRANVALSSLVMGDPLTPGWASLDSNGKTAEAVLALPSIPSIPISSQNTAKLTALILDRQGLSPRAELGEDAIFELRNKNEEEQKQKIWNLHGRINGADNPGQKVIVGAPRDSWCFGASDSASASGMLISLTAVFGALLKESWRPLRTIEFVSWDASTMNNAGSTEYVEDHLGQLRQGAVAYINVESAFGKDFYARGSPLLQRSLQRALSRVVAPFENETMETVFDLQQLPENSVMPISLPGADGDYGAFAHIAGVPVLDLGFKGVPQDLVKGSCYDTMGWLDKFGGDREAIHTALVQVWALVVLDLVSAPLLPLDADMFAQRLAQTVDELSDQVRRYVEDAGPSAAGITYDFTSLETAVAGLKDNAVAFHHFETEWTATVMGSGGLENLHWHHERQVYNDRITAFEKAFVDITWPGLKDRAQFKHALYAPAKWEPNILTMPTIWDLLQDNHWSEVQDEINRIADIIKRAGLALIGE